MPKERTNYGKIDPPEFHQLIEKCGGKTKRAEAAIGVHAGKLSKIRGGFEQYTDLIKRRIQAVLNDESIGPVTKRVDPTGIPENCPPILAELIRFCGNKKAATKALQCSESLFYKVTKGEKPMPPAWEPRAQAAMGKPVEGASYQAEAPPAGPTIPPFVPWDGKDMRTILAGARPGQKPRKYKLPTPLADLLERHKGNITAMAVSMGLNAGSLSGVINGQTGFSALNQRRVHAALHGSEPIARPSIEDFDKYTLNMAICILKASNFDRVNDIADILNGRTIFKMNTKDGWLVIYRIGADDLLKFKRLASRDCVKIACP